MQDNVCRCRKKHGKPLEYMDVQGYWSGPSIEQHQNESYGLILIYETDLRINASLKKLRIVKNISHLTHDDTLLLELVTISKVFGDKNFRISARDNLTRFGFEYSASMRSCIKNLMVFVH